MELIILNDGLYQLNQGTKKKMEHLYFTEPVDCLDLCDILRLKLSGYVDTLNLHIMKHGSQFIGCMCRQTYPKEGKVRVGNGEKLIFSTTILPQCQMVFSGVQ